MIVPDTKDWTWVIDRRCPECGFDGPAVHHTDVADRIRADADQWPRRLSAPEARIRPNPSVWSTLEYGCHIRDVHRIFDERVRLMLAEHAPRFPNWDQDATAIEDDYASQDPGVVGAQLVDAAYRVADTYDHVPDDGWTRRGLRSNGSEFTIASMAIYHLHDIVHHAHDVDRG
ncbi:methyltransferase type 12 [Mycolicibacterium agri]|uniref:Methyltransferase type 12 n=1 Tax=Mycolicibacterium agri TaxID=36811 RepID=A0A2A7N2R9_MYCAG|nr:DinB family protein [Mycolicibacterium agri]PEG38194.1 methyltransferase type 12 [Mycolicibacterium agri]GFG49341.1 methyltransferase type 12 [Mycolicibacterium agri]